MWFRHLFRVGLIGVVISVSSRSASGITPAMPGALRSHTSADDRDGPAEYGAWIDSAITKINGDDQSEQSRAADLLAVTIVDPVVRDKVLAALQPHLNGSDQSFRLRCVVAYGHWATQAQVKQLADVLASPETPKDVGPAARCWVAATTALVTLDPRAAQDVMQTRTGEFFYRADLASELSNLLADSNANQSAIYSILKQLDSGNSAVKVSVADAVALVKSDSANDRTKGANALAHAVITSHDRADVLAALHSHLDSTNARARLPFVQAFAHWADKDAEQTLKQLIATPIELKRGSGDEEIWAAATLGLMRIDPAAAGDAVKARADSGSFAFYLRNVILPIAHGNGENSSVACWLIGMMDQRNGQPRVPARFHLVPPNPSNSLAQKAA